MRLEELVRGMSGGRTQLAVGPVSKNVVDAAIEAANAAGQQLTLIPSRNQIECEELGKGYVNEWSTQAFTRYVRERDKQTLISICRDHGGPKQHPSEAKLSDTDAIISSSISLASDIEAGFDAIHLDMCHIAAAKRTGALFELYGHCHNNAVRTKKPLWYEVGMESQSGLMGSLEDFHDQLLSICALCDSGGFPRPLFVVAQTGTLVEGLSNVGLWTERSTPESLAALSKRTTEFVQVAHALGIFLKEHNDDYLPSSALSLRPCLGIGAVNIAPEHWSARKQLSSVAA